MLENELPSNNICNSQFKLQNQITTFYAKFSLQKLLLLSCCLSDTERKNAVLNPAFNTKLMEFERSITLLDF